MDIVSQVKLIRTRYKLIIYKVTFNIMFMMLYLCCGLRACIFEIEIRKVKDAGWKPALQYGDLSFDVLRKATLLQTLRKFSCDPRSGARLSQDATGLQAPISSAAFRLPQ